MDNSSSLAGRATFLPLKLKNEASSYQEPGPAPVEQINGKLRLTIMRARLGPYNVSTVTVIATSH